MLFPTTLVGSYPQPEWLIDRKKLAGRFPPRARAKAENIILAPDCGMKYLPRDVADGKMRAMVAGVQILRTKYS